MRTKTAPWDYDKRLRRTPADDFCLAQANAQHRYDKAAQAYDAFITSMLAGNTLGLTIDQEVLDKLARAANEAENEVSAIREQWKAWEAEQDACRDMAESEAERDYRDTINSVRPGA